MGRGARQPAGWSVRAAVLIAGLLAGCARQAPLPLPTPEERAELVWPAAPAEARFRWDTMFRRPGDLGLRTSLWRRTKRTIFGGPDDALVRPQGIAVIGERIVVTDPGLPRVLIYDTAAGRFTSLHATEARPWQAPTSVAGLADGTLFVADAAGGVFRLDPPRWARAERLEWDAVARPVAVAVDEARDRLYVLDSQRHQLLYGTLAGEMLGAFGQRGPVAGEFNFPTHLTVGPDGTIWVTDAMNFRVQQFTPDGRAINWFGKAGDGTGDFAKPKGIAIGRDGILYVADALHDVVQLFDREGRFLMFIGESGHEPGQFWMPTGVALDAEGRLYVADSYNRRVQVFAPARLEAP